MVSISSHARRYDMPMRCAAAVIEPASAMACSRSALPGPMAMLDPSSTRRRGAVTGGVAGDAGLRDAQQHGIAVAVEAQLDQALGLPGGFALAPQSPARPRPIADPAGGQGLLQSLVVHPCQHEHLAGVVLLGDDRHQAVVAETNGRGDLDEIGMGLAHGYPSLAP